MIFSLENQSMWIFYYLKVIFFPFSIVQFLFELNLVVLLLLILLMLFGKKINCYCFFLRIETNVFVNKNLLQLLFHCCGWWKEILGFHTPKAINPIFESTMVSVLNWPKWATNFLNLEKIPEIFFFLILVFDGLKFFIPRIKLSPSMFEVKIPITTIF